MLFECWWDFLPTFENREISAMISIYPITPKYSARSIWMLLFFGIFSLSTLPSCKNNKQTDSGFKMMKPTGNKYSAYCLSGNWVLEMDLNGAFCFHDFVRDYALKANTSEYHGVKESYKQKLVWNMFDGDNLEREIKFTVLQENCHNFAYVNNPFILQVYENGELIYQLGDCGTFHYEHRFVGRFKMIKANGKDAASTYKIKDIPILQIEKNAHSNMLSGRFACRFWQGDLKLLDNTMSINYNIHPTQDCIETPEITEFMETLNNKRFWFKISVDAKNRTLLTLMDKYDTFVFLKV